MIPLRPPEVVMRLSRLGAAHQTRLSFMRVMLRRMRREGWRVDRPVWQIDDNGVGRAVYRAIGPRRTYSLVAFGHELPDAMRSDRVIAEAWDATFALVDGEPTPADLDRLAANVPLQEAGRVSDDELVMSRANRSVRLWSHVVDSLAAGRQPDRAQIDAVGYLMRTTAVYGSGKFGAADRAVLADRSLMSGPFRAEMLAVWLIRTFAMDLVEHVAAARGGATAARLDPSLRRRFGIGNSTGLGMAPFLVNHPALLDAWITARETALARVRSLPDATQAARAIFFDRLDRARVNAAAWRSEHPLQRRRIAALTADLDRLADHLGAGSLEVASPWDGLYRWAGAHLSVEGQEQLVALMLEPHGDLVDDLAETMAIDEAAGFRIDGAASIASTRDILQARYDWCAGHDPSDPAQAARFWYVSEAKLEPRLGERYAEPGAEREQPLDIARQATALRKALADWPDTCRVADLLEALPQHRGMLRRLQIAQTRPYAEIRDNLCAADLLPIDMLRLKLAFFGATRFDPRSDRWVRITMYQNAPFPSELTDLPEDDWAYPARLPTAEVAA